ncbi:hypothetical protein BC629DRAFT_1444125 [Irpex lacteus]|nr:hypothetical protein BC629DRAFT_1444125 [Irpex lacteus]
MLPSFVRATRKAIGCDYTRRSWEYPAICGHGAPLRRKVISYGAYVVVPYILAVKDPSRRQYLSFDTSHYEINAIKHGYDEGAVWLRKSEIVRRLQLAGNVARYLTPVIARGVHPSMMITPGG